MIQKNTNAVYRELPGIGHGTGRTFTENVVTPMRKFLDEKTYKPPEVVVEVENPFDNMKSIGVSDGTCKY